MSFKSSNEEKKVELYNVSLLLMTLWWWWETRVCLSMDDEGVVLLVITLF